MEKLKLIFILICPILFYFAVKILVLFNFNSICLWKTITGHECWGCGITRALNEVFSGNFRDAFLYNKFIIIIAPIMLYLWFKMLYKTLK